MGKFVLCLAILAGMVLTLGACADSPTNPDQRHAAGVAPLQDSEVQGCVVGGVCVLPPISGGGCDPWMELDWCQGGGGNCMYSTPNPGDPHSTGTMGCGLGGGGGGGGGGSGGGGGYIPPPGDCNPQYDPDCNQPLTNTDLATLGNAFSVYIRPATQFTDPAKAEQCRQLKAEYDRMLASGVVFRGGYDTPPNDPHTGVHYGAYDPVSRTMHFEPSALDAANAGDAAMRRSLVNTALHEAAHSLQFTHTDPVMSGSYDLYAEAPFNLLSPGANSCLTCW
jgi:hypothetical protein